MKNIIGSSLVEVMVSLFLLTTVLLGFDLMEGFAIQTNHSALELTIAALQINSMTERLKALDIHQGINQQINKWNQQNKIVLPSSRGVVLGNYPHYTVEIHWRKSKCIRKKL